MVTAITGIAGRKRLMRRAVPPLAVEAKITLACKSLAISQAARLMASAMVLVTCWLCCISQSL